MLFASVSTQHAARCQQNKSRAGKSSVCFQHRRCTVVQSRRIKPCQALAAEVTSTAGANSKSSSRSSNSSSDADIFHNRERELKALKDHCRSRPTAITVIFGPRNSGKTALLNQYMRDLESADNICFIDARVTPISTPSDLAQVLWRSAIPNLARRLFQNIQRLSDALAELTASAEAIIMQALAGDTEQVPPLGPVTAAYAALLNVWHKASASGQLSDASPPVLIIDEANVLMDWDDQHRTARQDLLSFFVNISKAQSRSHVVLATSDYPFIVWLTQEIGWCFSTFVVGDFPAQEAREFLNKCLQRQREPEVSDADWKDVHKVCGGNPGALLQAAGFYQTLGGWEAALTQLTRDVWISIKPGYWAAADASYNTEDFALAVLNILDSDYKAVRTVDLEPQLGKPAFDAMVQANLLAVRPYSSWAADIDVEAFGPGQRFPVITAPSPIHLFFWEQERKILLGPLDWTGLTKTDSSTPPQ